MLGDKGYDSDAIIAQVTASGAEVVIPPKANRKVQCACDYVLYCERNLVERFFNKLKQFRRVATRYDKRATHFLSGVYLGSAVILLK
mgnify:CR=1 FL=1